MSQKGVKQNKTVYIFWSTCISLKEMKERRYWLLIALGRWREYSNPLQTVGFMFLKTMWLMKLSLYEENRIRQTLRNATRSKYIKPCNIRWHLLACPESNKSNERNANKRQSILHPTNTVLTTGSPFCKVHNGKILANICWCWQPVWENLVLGNSGSGFLTTGVGRELWVDFNRGSPPSS